MAVMKMQEGITPSCQNPCHDYNSKACQLCQTIDKIEQFCIDMANASEAHTDAMGICWRDAILALTDGIGDIIAES